MPSLADVWEQHHGRAMTDEEAEMIAARAPEVEAALAKMMRSLSGPTRLADGMVATPKASNWQAREKDGFTPIQDRNGGVSGKSVEVRVDLGVRRINKKKKKNK